jgi:hypothetical protein
MMAMVGLLGQRIYITLLRELARKVGVDPTAFTPANVTVKVSLREVDISVQDECPIRLREAVTGTVSRVLLRVWARTLDIDRVTLACTPQALQELVRALDTGSGSVAPPRTARSSDAVDGHAPDTLEDAHDAFTGMFGSIRDLILSRVVVRVKTLVFTCQGVGDVHLHDLLWVQADRRFTLDSVQAFAPGGQEVASAVHAALDVQRQKLTLPSLHLRDVSAFADCIGAFNVNHHRPDTDPDTDTLPGCPSGVQPSPNPPPVSPLLYDDELFYDALDGTDGNDGPGPEPAAPSVEDEHKDEDDITSTAFEVQIECAVVEVPHAHMTVVLDELHFVTTFPDTITCASAKATLSHGPGLAVVARASAASLVVDSSRARCCVTLQGLGFLVNEGLWAARTTSTEVQYTWDPAPPEGNSVTVLLHGARVLVGVTELVRGHAAPVQVAYSPAAGMWAVSHLVVEGHACCTHWDDLQVLAGVASQSSILPTDSPPFSPSPPSPPSLPSPPFSPSPPSLPSLPSPPSPPSLPSLPSPPFSPSPPASSSSTHIRFRHVSIRLARAQARFGAEVSLGLCDLRVAKNARVMHVAVEDAAAAIFDNGVRHQVLQVNHVVAVITGAESPAAVTTTTVCRIIVADQCSGDCFACPAGVRVTLDPVTVAALALLQAPAGAAPPTPILMAKAPACSSILADVDPAMFLPRAATAAHSSFGGTDPEAAVTGAEEASAAASAAAFPPKPLVAVDLRVTSIPVVITLQECGGYADDEDAAEPGGGTWASSCRILVSGRLTLPHQVPQPGGHGGASKQPWREGPTVVLAVHVAQVVDPTGAVVASVGVTATATVPSSQCRAVVYDDAATSDDDTGMASAPITVRVQWVMPPPRFHTAMPCISVEVHQTVVVTMRGETLLKALARFSAEVGANIGDAALPPSGPCKRLTIRPIKADVTWQGTLLNIEHYRLEVPHVVARDTTMLHAWQVVAAAYGKAVAGTKLALLKAFNPPLMPIRSVRSMYGSLRRGDHKALTAEGLSAAARVCAAAATALETLDGVLVGDAAQRVKPAAAEPTAGLGLGVGLPAATPTVGPPTNEFRAAAKTLSRYVRHAASPLMHAQTASDVALRVPVVLVRPLIGLTMATRHLLRGLGKTLDPHQAVFGHRKG